MYNVFSRMHFGWAGHHDGVRMSSAGERMK